MGPAGLQLVICPPFGFFFFSRQLYAIELKESYIFVWDVGLRNVPKSDRTDSPPKSSGCSLAALTIILTFSKAPAIEKMGVRQ